MPGSHPTFSTDALTKHLASQAGQTSGPLPGQLATRLVLAIIVAYMVATAGIFLLVGGRPDLFMALMGPAIYFKLVSMLLLILGAAYYTYQSSLPNRHKPLGLLVLPVITVILIRIFTDHSGQSWLGVHTFSFTACVSTIVLASFVPLAIVLGIVKAGATQSPGRSGAVAGVLAGAIGAGSYAWTCQNDAGLFLLVWYSVSVCLVAIIGYVVGKRVLKW